MDFLFRHFLLRLRCVGIKVNDKITHIRDDSGNIKSIYSLEFFGKESIELQNTFASDKFVIAEDELATTLLDIEKVLKCSTYEH